MRRAFLAIVAVAAAVSAPPLAAQTVVSPVLVGLAPAREVLAKAKSLAESIALTRDRDYRDSVWAELVALVAQHEEARPFLAQATVAVFDGANRRMNTQSSRRAFKKLIRAREDLDQLRTATLALVRDEELYPYPFTPPNATEEQADIYLKTQVAIDAKLDLAREIWFDGPDVRFTRDLRSGGERVLWARSKAKWLLENMALKAELESPDVPQWMHSLQVERASKVVDVQTFALTPAEAAQVAHDLSVLDRNKLLFKALREEAESKAERQRTDFEREQVALTNDYRRMLGLRPLSWNLSLHRAARNHADYLVVVGGVAHNQGVPEFATSQLRARSFGYGGAVWENCHRGSKKPRASLHALIHSSAHHRTILASNLTEMATGKAGEVWVQDFGATNSLESEIRRHPWRD